MSVAPVDKYALQRAITRAVRALQDAGLEVGGVEIAPGGLIRVLTKDSAKADPFSDWQKRRAS
jgi:hypothetical protein